MRGAAAAAALVAFAAFATGGLASAPKAKPITEIALPGKAGSTHELTLGPDGNVWVTQQVQGNVIRVTPSGQQSVFPMPDGSMPHGIKFARDGHLWITLEVANEIAELDGGGHLLRRFPIKGTLAGPHGLAIAPDGAVWFTGKEGDVIGRLDPATGRMRLFPLPHDSTPIFIAPGCGAMFFTELRGSRIGRITNAGHIIEYPTPTPDAQPIAVAIRHCKVWFSEEAGHHFGVLDPRRHRIKEYPLPHPTDTLAALAFDRRGTLWLQFKTPDAFGSVGAHKRVHTFPLGRRNAVMHRIILGPRGDMWFTELMTDRVGHFKPH